MPRGESQVITQPGPLTRNAILDNLHSQELSFAEKFSNPRGLVSTYLKTLSIQLADIRRMNKSRSLKTDIHECGFHAGHHSEHFTLEYIAYVAARAVPLEHQFFQSPLLD
jgi:hypothetical protein